ncbi:asparagine synthase (glutamine-hydrolyzing) [Cryobacterium sp. CG_9.6]|uniref:asparagine synthase (glutamine-hydrolyzing) n=1 Tax=Cryobacterium sp. CG_9.6 TaxID=2760710 RepID=UPI0024735074|nr:asparagine synthase (glutamine-hydrolyzing) [Cryobacterium sp. CG_9.6]MDH6238269.1 asparagine synthase (glutamine-hydrolyzing) [Cryobacterium sp. CG_9.6]
MGIQHFDGTAVEATVLGTMTRCLAHRGPDGHGFWHSGGVGFAHTRLSIIDLAGSKQPMHSVDARWVLTFNGEIFNYRQLRAGLRYPFHTDGDTEVILAGVSQHGIGWIDNLIGQFAFALHDTFTGTTHLVRDRLGVLPLYYSHTSRQLLFASEIKALLTVLPQAPGVDMLSIDSYLAARSVPSPHTLFEGVSKLPPAHRAEVTREGKITIIRYWQPPAADPRSRWPDPAAIDAVDQAVTEAVDASLVADVPVGAYLSGGVDSSLIVAKIAALRPQHRVQTFAAGFGDARTDELPWARRVSEHVGTDHHEVNVDASDFETLWPQLTWHRDSPISEPADIAVYRLAQTARQSVSVVLSGEGGDELFAGYPKYRAARAVATASLLPFALRSKVIDSIEGHLPVRLARARIALRAAGAVSRDEQYRTWFAPFTSAERTGLLRGIPTRAPARDVTTSGSDTIRNMLLTDLDGWLPDNLLERGDRMSMAASLELRPPLLDHRLVELAFRLPSSVKVRNGTTKWVLKEVARRYLPTEVVDRRKVGFRVPLDQWFRTGLRDSMWDRLTGKDSFVAQTFDQTAVRDLLKRHESGRFSEENRIWTLMCLEVWHETFFRAEGPVAMVSESRTEQPRGTETYERIDQ